MGEFPRKSGRSQHLINSMGRGNMLRRTGIVGLPFLAAVTEAFVAPAMIPTARVYRAVSLRQALAPLDMSAMRFPDRDEGDRMVWRRGFYKDNVWHPGRYENLANGGNATAALIQTAKKKHAKRPPRWPPRTALDAMLEETLKREIAPPPGFRSIPRAVHVSKELKETCVNGKVPSATNFLSADFLHTLSEEELHAAYVVRRAGLKLCDCSQRSFLSLGHGNFTSQDCAADVWQVLQLTKTDGPDTHRSYADKWTKVMQWHKAVEAVRRGAFNGRYESRQEVQERLDRLDADIRDLHANRNVSLMQNRLSHAEYELLHRSFKEETAELLETIARKSNPYDGKRVEVDWVDRTPIRGDFNFVLEPIGVVPTHAQDPPETLKDMIAGMHHKPTKEEILRMVKLDFLFLFESQDEAYNFDSGYADTFLPATR